MSGFDESKLLAALDQGETLVWSGRPCSRLNQMRVAVIECLFGLVFVGFTLFWVHGVIYGGGNWDRGRNVPPFAFHNVLLATFVGLSGVSVGTFMVLSPLRAWWRSGRTHYVLTNRRAIVCEIDRTKCRIVYELPSQSLGLMIVSHYFDGTGNLIFGTRPTMVRGMNQPYGFLDVDDVDGVNALVRKTLTQDSL